MITWVDQDGEFRVTEAHAIKTNRDRAKEKFNYDYPDDFEGDMAALLDFMSVNWADQQEPLMLYRNRLFDIRKFLGIQESALLR